MTSHTRAGWPRARALARGAVLALLAAAAPAAAGAQTDYYNTDAGRPLQVEDAYAIERWAFELQAAPVRLERSAGGYRWGVEPELAFGVLPRTQLEVGLPFAWFRAPGTPAGRVAGLTGIDVSVLHNLNAETAIPALAVAASVLIPAGEPGAIGDRRAYPSVKAIATRTWPRARVHANAQYTAGATPAPGALGAGAAELSRWVAGVSVDRALPLRSLLPAVELVARRPLAAAEPVEWSAGAGLRAQLDPRWAMDAGGGRRVTGDDRGWYLTVGGAYAFGVRGLMPK